MAGYDSRRLVHALVTIHHKVGSRPKPVSVCPGRVRSQVVLEVFEDPEDEEAVIASVVEKLREAFEQLRTNPPLSSDSSYH